LLAGQCEADASRTSISVDDRIGNAEAENWRP